MGQQPLDALDRFDRLGGFDALTLDLWRDGLGAIADSRPAAGCGWVRSGSDAQQAADHDSARLGSAGSGQDRTPSVALGVTSA